MRSRSFRALEIANRDETINSMSVTSPRGVSECRGCLSSSLSDVIDLGSHPIPSEYGLRPDQSLEAFPLQLRICEDCGLGQLGEYVLPERIFHDSYPYLSSASSTWILHSRRFASDAAERLNLRDNSLVLELASNDGYLLKEFQKLGIGVLGIEPAGNVAKMSLAAGVPTITEFFGANLARQIVKDFGYPDLIVANNVFAHVPDLQDFTSGLEVLAGPETLISIENPSFLRLLAKGLFDTIYHEHYSYHTAHSVRAVGRLHGLELVKVEKLETHGGSNRYWLKRDGQADATVDEIIEFEESNGLFDASLRARFAEKSFTSIEGLRKWLVEKSLAEDSVVAFGAAHKGNTFLNAVGANSTLIKYVVDASHEKQGKYLPGSRIPVFAPQHLQQNPPTDVLILPWNIADELANQVRLLSPKSRVWVAQPQIREIKL